MIHDLQTASVWKRISAALFDFLMLVVVVEGLVLLLTAVFGFNSYIERRDEIEDRYITEYGINRDMTEDELNALPDDEKATYQAKVEAANKAYQSDPEVAMVFGKLFSLALLIATFSILIAFLIWEFAIPLILKNGQTLGQKIFGIAVMRIDGVKVSPVMVFARGILGKCTICTLVPIYLLLMVYFGLMGVIGTVVFFGIILAQIILFLATRDHTPLHDKFAQTVTVDIASQLIFDSTEELLEYKKRIAAENAERSEY